MTLLAIYEKVAEELGLPVSLVSKSYRAYWQFNRTSISTLPLSEELTEEQFNLLKTSINIPSIGKLYCSYPRYKSIKNRFDLIKKLKVQDDKHKED